MFAGLGLHVSKINGVYQYEDQQIRDYMMRLLTVNHDCIARLKWSPNTVALYVQFFSSENESKSHFRWDNRWYAVFLSVQACF